MYNFEFHPLVVFRAPRLPVSTEFDIDILENYFSNEIENEALFLASPSVFQILEKWLAGGIFDQKSKTKLINTLGKYYLRTANRPTPFGLFAGISSLSWGASTNIQIIDYERSTRLDMSFLGEFYQKLLEENSIRKELEYYANSTLYFVNGEYRYVEIYFENSKRFHKISSIQANIYISKTLKFIGKKGASYSKILTYLITLKIGETEASLFLDELIKIQFLNSQIEPNITGNYYSKLLKNQLKNILGIDHFWYKNFENIENSLLQLDKAKSNKIDQYFEIIELVKPFELGESRLDIFQVDMHNKLAANASLSSNFKHNIANYLQFLCENELIANATNLEIFKDKFYERYQDQEVPLALALDTENGIGYLSKNNADFNPIIDDISFGNEIKNQAIRTTNKQKLYEILAIESEGKSAEVKLDLIEFKSNLKVAKQLPSSFNILFRVFEKEQLFLESVCGSTAATLLGRFANINTQINEMLSEISLNEAANNPDIIFAEIVHLPENRSGNVIMHPVFHQYEIPYLANASVKLENQISVNDLFISVVDNQLIMRSKRLNKAIIPRLSNAHNYVDDALPVYQFLCDLQHQNTYPFLNLDFDLICNGLKYIPRITFQNIIINLATWNFKKADYASVKDEQSFKRFVFYNNLPNIFILAENDNELVLDINNKLSIEILFAQFENSESIILKEFINYWPEIQDINRKMHANQFVATGINQRKFQNVIYKNNVPKKIIRKFEFGSEWLYFKLYCGAGTADKILINNIYKFVKKAFKNKLIDSWFFIRYNDPEPHIRVRFHLSNINFFVEVLQRFNKSISKLVSENIIWKTQAEMYERELERYGFESIGYHEQLFKTSSIAYLEFYRNTIGDEREQFRLTFAMQIIDITLKLFGLANSQKLVLLKELSDSFNIEFNLNRNERIKIDDKYRKYKELIFNEMTYDKSVFYTTLTKFENTSKPIVENILAFKKFDLKNQIASQIHMHVNRIFSSNQRQHELIVYDFLVRFYTTISKQAT